MSDNVDTVCGIYAIQNIINGHMYIGSSKDIEGRVGDHSNALNLCKHCNNHLQNAFNAYGYDNFVYCILIICDVDMLLYYEQCCIDVWKPEYNLSYIAGKVEMTDDVRHKLSVANIGKKLSDETKHKIAASGIGKKRSDETKHKIAVANSKRHVSEETRRKISKAGMGRIKSEETRHKLSVANKGKKRSDAAKRKYSLSKLGNNWCTGIKQSEETKRKKSIALKKYFASKKKEKVGS